MPPVSGEKRGAARPSKPLSKGVSRCLRDICSIFLSCSANEAEKEKVYKDSQVDRDEDAESEDCPQDGLPITSHHHTLQIVVCHIAWSENQVAKGAEHSSVA